jgi:hypothetical protein
LAPRGKSASSRNATTHGLCAKSLLLGKESVIRFNQVARGLHEEYKPETPSESAAVDAMIYARWCQLRRWTLQQCTINNAIRQPDEVLYERQFARALRRLETIRAFRKMRKQ